MKDKLILDPCCGSKMMWYDKTNPEVLFGDIRIEKHTLCDGRALIINPDMQMDFTKMPFEDNTFYHVVFDPPHMVKLGQNSWMAKKYGVLKYHWRDDIRDGFNECMRVLKPFCTLVFKWNESQINEAEILKIIEHKPLYGHRSGKGGKTIWMCFMKDNSAPITGFGLTKKEKKQ